MNSSGSMHPLTAAGIDALFTKAERVRSEEDNVNAANVLRLLDELKTLRQSVTQLRLEAARNALWASHLLLRLGELKKTVRAFASGTGPAPWSSHTPRVIGFKEEFDVMVRVVEVSDPILFTSEQIAALFVPPSEELGAT